MIKCKNCIHYDEKIDKLKMMNNDTSKKECHYCFMLDTGISEPVWNGNKECKYYDKKGTVNT